MELNELLSLEWEPRVLAEYDRLKTNWGDGEAERYLQVVYNIDRHPRAVRDLNLVFDPFVEQRSRWHPVVLGKFKVHLKGRSDTQKEYKAGIQHFIMQILHPNQLPMQWKDVEQYFYQEGIALSGCDTLRTWLNELVDQERLKKFCNPYRGNTFLFCNAEFQEQPQVGDRVIELMRRRGSRIGTVVRFRTYRDRNRYPVVNWEYSVRTQKPLACQFESFANPETLVVIERPDPITQKVS